MGVHRAHPRSSGVSGIIFSSDLGSTFEMIIKTQWCTSLLFTISVIMRESMHYTAVITRSWAVAAPSRTINSVDCAKVELSLYM